MPDTERPYIVTKGVDLLKKVAETNGIKADPEEYLKRSNGNYSDAMDIMLDENGYEPYDEATKKQIHDKEQLPILSSDYILKNRLSDAEQKDLETKSNEIFDKLQKGYGTETFGYEKVQNFKYDEKDKVRLKAELNTINERLRRDSDLRDLLPNVIKPEENVLGQKSYKKLKNEANKEIDSFTPASGLSYRDYSPVDQKILLEDQKREKAQKNLQEKIELDKEYLSDPVVITANTAAVTAKALGNKEKEGLYASKKILNDQAAKLNRQYDMALEKFRAEPTEENGARVDYIGAHIDAQAKEIAKGDKIANAVSIYARKKAKEVEAKAEVQGTIANIGTYLGNVGLSVRDRIANGLDDIISGKDDTLEEHQAKNLERGIAEADRMQQSGLRGGFRERYVEVDGQKLVVDNDGEVLYGVDDKFRPTDKDISKFIAKYEVNPDAYEQKADYSPTRLIGTSIQVMADMVPIIAANAAIGVASAALPGGQAKTLQALGSIGASAVTMFSDNLKRNLELGKGYNYAWNTAMGTTLVQALIEQAGGLEARAGRALGETAKTAMRTKLDDLVQSYAGRSLAKTDLVKKAKGVIKEYIGEGFEESGQDITAQVSDHMFYGVDVNIDWNDQFNTWASLPLGVGGVKAIVGHLQNKADRDMMRRGYNAAQSSTSGFNEVLDSQVADKSITEKEASIKKEVLSESKADYDAINDNYDHITEKGKNRLVSLMADRDMNRMMAKYIEIGPGKETYAKKAEELDKKFRDLWKELDEKGRKNNESGHGDVRGINFDVETIKDEDNERQESGDVNGDTQGTGTGEEAKAEGENKGAESQAGGTNNADSGGNAEGAVSVLTKEAEDLLERRRQQELKDNSRHIFISSELFVDENGDHYKIQNLANGKKRISASDENGKTLSVLDEYEQQVPNDAIIAGGLTKVKDLNFTNKLKDEINAKYDAELATLKQKRDGKATNEPSGVQREATTEDGAGQPGASDVDPAGTKQEAVQETVPSGNKMSVLESTARKIILNQELTAEEKQERANNPTEVDRWVKVNRPYLELSDRIDRLSDSIEDIKFRTNYDPSIPYQDSEGNQGTITIDNGGKAEFVYKGGVKELGNISGGISENMRRAGIVAKGKVQPLGGGQYSIDGVFYKNNLSDPARAINIDKEGNVVSVDLDEVQGGYNNVQPVTKSKTFTGPQAEELAYQIHLEKISKDEKRFIQYVRERGDGSVPTETQEGAVENNDGLSKGEDKQGEADKQAAKGEVRPEEQEVKRTLSGLTEEERLAIIEVRKKETKFSDTEKGMQEFWSLVDRYEGLIEGARGKSSTSGQQLWGDILQKSKPLKIEVTRTKGGGVTKVVAKKGGKRLKNVKSYKEGNYKAISPNEDKALLDNRSGKVQDIFSKLYHNLESPGIQIEYGVKLSDVQKEQAFNDVADGIPSNGAEAVLDVVEKFVQDGNIIIYDESMGTRAIPIDEFFGNQDLEWLSQQGVSKEVGVGGDVHKQNIHDKFRKEFEAKGVPKEQVDGAIALMEARAKSWASEEKGRNPDDWYSRIADVKSGEFVNGSGKQFQVEAYHGSPHDFDKFSTSKVGTGEGAQAFGYGLYFTDLKGIAEEYARRLSNDSPTIDGKKIDDWFRDNDLKAPYSSNYWMPELLSESKSKEEALSKIDLRIKSQEGKIDRYNDILDDGESTKNERAGARSALEVLEKDLQVSYDLYNAVFRSKSFEPPTKSRNLYKVSLHEGKQLSEYDWLEWDKPVSEKQKEKVKSEFLKEWDGEIVEVKYGANKGKFISEPFAGTGVAATPHTHNTRAEAESRIKMQHSTMLKFLTLTDGKSLYKTLGIYLKSEKSASEFLLKSGIDGVKYPAESIARGATSDNARGFNYVVFDDKAVTIKEKIQFQNQKGAVETLADGRKVIHALDAPDFSTMVHEIAHVFEGDLTAAEQKIVKDFGGSEPFARGFERYIRDGESPTPELKTLFDKFKEWLTNIYKTLKGSPIEKRISPEIKQIFDRLLTEQKAVEQSIQEDMEEPPFMINNGEVQNARKALDNATKRLREAEKRIAEANGVQMSAFNAPQGSLFGVKGEDIKAVIDPLKKAVKEAREAYDKAVAKAEAEENAKNGQQSLFQKEKRKLEPIDTVLFNKLLKNLNKAIPGVFGGVLEKKAFGEKLKEMHGISMRDKKGIIYGFVGHDGKVYLNGDVINANTPIHEYGHIFINIMKDKFPQVYRRGLNLADKSPYLSTLLSQGKKSDYAPLIERYKNGDKTALQEEALAMAIGDMGERMVQRNMKNAFLEWVDKMWTAIKRVFGGRLTDMTPEQLNRLTFKQFSNLVAGQLLAGDPVSGELVVQMINNYRGKKPLSDPEFRNIYEESKKLKKEYGDTDNYTKFQVLPDGSKVGVGLPLFQIIGEKGAGQLDNAPNIVQAAKRLDNLEVAKNMESKGADARTIFLATGWQKGGDGKWKTEIGDITFNNLFEGDNPIAMQIEDNGFVKLGDLVSGEVLDAYPYLKDVPVKFVKGTPGNGQYDGKEIKLQYKSEMDFIINEQLLLKALAHEVQHFVQDQEGFAKGTTSDYFTEDKLNYMTQLVYEDFIFRNLEYDEYIKQHGNAAESVLEPLDEWEDFQKEAKKGKDNVIKILADAKRHSLSKYRKVAGEVEANNVMKRMDMPLSERLVKTFTDTEDVAEDEKIYLFDSKVSNSTFDLNKYKAEKRRERAEDNVNRAKANLFNAWNNLKTVGVVSDPWQNSQNMKRVIDAAIELAIQVGAKTKEEIKAALNDVIKKHNLSPNQLNNIARAVKAYSEPFDQDIFNDLVQNTDSAHEAFGFLRLMRQNTKDPIKYGKVLKLEDELTKRQIEYEESQQVPEGTENNTKAEILKSFGEALTSYKMPLSQPKDVAITGAYNPLIDNEVFGTTMQASMLHATGFVKNWFDLFKARDISTKAFFQEVADYLAANPGSIYSEPIANASYRLLAELKRGYKNDKYWDSIYDIMNIPAQAQRRSNLGIALALGSQESSGHAFSGKLEAIEQFKAGLNENLTDEELDENNHGEIKRLGAEIHEEEGNRRPIPPPGYLQRKARRAYKEVEQSVINRVKEKIKGCK